MNFEELYRLVEESFLSSEKNYYEAWELFHLKNPNVKKLIKNIFKLNYPNSKAMDEDPKIDELAHKLGAYIDTLPVIEYSWKKIPSLKEIDSKWIKIMQSIQDVPDVKEKYAELMAKRDNEGDERPDGKLTNERLFNDVEQRINDPVVLLKLSKNMYAVGGRTRMFAALASKTNIKAIILTPKILSKFVESKKAV